MGLCSMKWTTRIVAWVNLIISFGFAALHVTLLVAAIVHKIDWVLDAPEQYVLLVFRIIEFVTATILVVVTTADKEVKVTVKWIWIWFYANLIIFWVRTIFILRMSSLIAAIEMVNRFFALTFFFRVYLLQPTNVLSISAPITAKTKDGTGVV